MNHEMNYKFPRLIEKLGPVPVEAIDKLRLYVDVCRGYQEGARSLRKAYVLASKSKVSWQTFRASAFHAENLFSDYFGNVVELFDKLGEGMAWIGLTEHGHQALELAEEFISWYDSRHLSAGGAR
jgi:hypothetical protein